MKKQLLSIRVLFINILCLGSLCSGNYCLATQVKQWTEKDITLRYHGVVYSLNSGAIEQGPQTIFHQFQDDFSFLAAVLDHTGTPILGGGKPASIVSFNKGSFADVTELKKTKNRSISAIEIADDNGSVIAGMTPSGSIITIKKNGENLLNENDSDLIVDDDLALLEENASNLLCKLPVKAILDLERTASGHIYAATGPQGHLYRINVATNVCERWATSPDNYLYSLLSTTSGTLYVGGSESGNLYRLAGHNKLEVFYNFPEGMVAKIIEYQGGLLVATNVIKEEKDAKKLQRYKKYFEQFTKLEQRFGISESKKSTLDPIRLLLDQLSGGVVYFVKNERIDRLFTLSEDYILDIFADKQGQVFLATGPRGRVYMVKDILQDDRDLMLAMTFDYKEVTDILGHAGRPTHYLISGNNAGVFSVSDKPNTKTMVETPVFSPGVPHKLGWLYWQGTNLEVYSRHGATHVPDETWSDWTKRPKGSPDEVPAGFWRYVQLRFLAKKAAKLHGFRYYYNEFNQRPRVDDLKVSSQEKTDKGYQRTLTWKMIDANKDTLAATIFVKEDKNTWWLPVNNQKPIKTGEYKLNIDSLPDGHYRAKVIATDKYSNFDKALEGFAISDEFIVDKLPPVWKNAKLNTTEKRIYAQIYDQSSHIQDIALSTGDDTWFQVTPVDGILDESTEEIEIDLNLDWYATVQTVILRSIDAAGNEAKLLLELPAPKTTH